MNGRRGGRWRGEGGGQRVGGVCIRQCHYTRCCVRRAARVLCLWRPWEGVHGVCARRVCCAQLQSSVVVVCDGPGVTDCH